MSFLTDLFKGDFSNLGNDLNPSNIFNDTGKDIGGKYTVPELLGVGGLALGGLGAIDLLGVGADAAATGAAAGDLAGGLGTAATTADTALGFSDVAAATDPGLTAIDAATAGSAGAVDASGLTIAGTDTAVGLGPGFGAATSTAIPGFSTVAGAGSSSSFLNSLASGAETSLTKNPLGILAAGAGLGLSFLRGDQTDPNQKALSAEAPQLLAQGQAITQSGLQLQTYLSNGTLPPALQAQVAQAVQAEKARIIQNYASSGQNTNPTQNSALAQELSGADMNGLSLAGQLEQQLFTSGSQLLSTGINETGLSTQLYETLAKMDEANNAQLMSSIASFAAALGGGTRISIGGQAATLAPA
jgi:hypothetical protein